MSAVVLSIEENGWIISVASEPRAGRSNPRLAARWLSSLDPPRFIHAPREDYHSTLYDHFSLTYPSTVLIPAV